MAKKVALGKGLKALLPSIETETGEEQEGNDKSASQLYKFQDNKKGRLIGRVAEIEVTNIRPNPYQPRLTFEEEALDELAASIQQLGIIQPITVRSLGDGQFEIISGERRLRASRRAGLKKLPAFVREADTEEMLEMAIVENVQREQLNPMEISLGYQRLMEECDLTQEKIAQKVGKKRATVANFLRLLKLPPPVQAALRDESISMGHARALIPVDDKEVQLDILTEIEVAGLSVRDVERRVRMWQEASENAKDGKDQVVEELTSVEADRDQLQIQKFANRLRAHFSTQVLIKHKKGGDGGKIEIEYYSNEDLERLMELLEQQ
ncbi:MAG: ParB/RepB/Spo0J family partition protein [Rhodothermales bacterium]